MRKKVNKLINKIFIKKLEREPKVFCLSMQRSGTTSVGQFFKDHNFRWSGWGDDKRNNWAQSWFKGEFDAIFNSEDFRLANAYEDSPWWFPKFYEEIYRRFPDSKFILLKRDPSKWYKSMLLHSLGNVIGAVNTHCKIYKREDELERLISAGTSHEELTKLSGKKVMKMEGMENHYVKCYNKYYEEVRSFFKQTAPDALFVGQLEDDEKWAKIGHFLDIKVDESYDSHKNHNRSKFANK